MKVTLSVALGTKPKSEESSWPGAESYKADPSRHQRSHWSEQPLRISPWRESRQQTAAVRRAVRQADAASAQTHSFTAAPEAPAPELPLTRGEFFEKQKGSPVLECLRVASCGWLRKIPIYGSEGAIPVVGSVRLSCLKQWEHVRVTGPLLNRVPVV